MKWHWGYLINPIGAVADYINEKRGATQEQFNDRIRSQGGIVKTVGEDLGEKFQKGWEDITGQTAINQEFENNKELAKYQTDMQEELYNKYSSPEAMMKQYEAAGLNPNLVYSGASSGQSNVPTYSSPAAAHQMSYTDKLNKALSIISSIQGVRNLIYSTVANREAAEQSAIKTANMFTNLRRNRIQTDLLGEQVGYNGWLQLDPFFRRSSVGRKHGGSVSFSDPLPGLIEYAGALRSEILNRAHGAFANNYWMNGSGFNLSGNLISGSHTPRNYWLNYGTEYQALGRKFDYDWNNDYKTMLKGAGVASPIIQTLLRLLGGK